MEFVAENEKRVRFLHSTTPGWRIDFPSSVLYPSKVLSYQRVVVSLRFEVANPSEELPAVSPGLADRHR